MNPESRDPAAGAPRSALARFLRADDGAVMVEYIILVCYVFLAVNLTITPLKEKLIEFAKDVVTQMHLP